LCTWARRNGYELNLLESFIGHHHSPNERWNDFVAVFVKGDEFVQRHSRRIVHRTQRFYNARVHGQDAVLNEQLYPEDQQFGLALENRFNDQLRHVAELESLLGHTREDLRRRLATVAGLESRQNELLLEISRLRESHEKLTHGLSWQMSAPLRTLEHVLGHWAAASTPRFYKFKREYYRLIGKPQKVVKYNSKLLALREKAARPPGGALTFGILTTRHTLFVAHAIEAALREAGFATVLMTEVPRQGYDLDIYFVLCPQMFSPLPPGEKRIAFQFEQSVSSRWFKDEYFETLKCSLAVLDYSQVNLKYLEQNGITYPHTFYVPVNYIENYDPYLLGNPTTQSEASDPGFDVLFYGDPDNDRRQRLLRAISSHFRTRVTSEVYGADLHRELRQAKVVVNIHYYEGALLETTRIYECLSLGVPVVSELGSDMQEHENLRGLVDFVEVGNERELIDAIRHALERPPRDVTGTAGIGQARFRFMLMRAMLALKLIDFDKFSTLVPTIDSATNRFCLSLPETTVRRAQFMSDRQVDVELFDGIRYSPGWVGCALSYKFLCQHAELNGRPRILICEDDVEFSVGFRDRVEKVMEYLERRNTDWDVFCGLIAHLHPEASIESVEQVDGETFVTMDRMTSTVFNIYNRKAIELIADWDPGNLDVTTNTIDRYLEHHPGLRVITTLPFLVGHHEDMSSSLWGFNNREYTAMISQSQALLQSKVDQFLASQHAENDSKAIHPRVEAPSDSARALNSC